VELKRPYSVDHLNSLSQEEFVRIVGPVFERSPWIAEEAWPRRPFAGLDHLHCTLCNTVRGAAEEKQLGLIRAHPDLVGRAALAGTLTLESNREQASAGLNHLTSAEIATFQELNQAYREKFGFPFVICARLNKREAILNGFRARLQHSQAEEIQMALAEIEKIAYLRLQDIVHN
jgi:OHCU decarboxylase